jgi:hypothetical protein
MTPRSLNTLATVCWLTLLLSVAVLFLFLLNTPEVTLYRDTAERDKAIRAIKEEADVSRLQQEATWRVSGGYATGATATLLCRVALVAQVLIISGAVVSLINVRRIRRAFDESEREGASRSTRKDQ